MRPVLSRLESSFLEEWVGMLTANCQRVWPGSIILKFATYGIGSVMIQFLGNGKGSSVAGFNR